MTLILAHALLNISLDIDIKLKYTPKEENNIVDWAFTTVSIGFVST